jgi:hypothetical protein
MKLWTDVIGMFIMNVMNELKNIRLPHSKFNFK